MKFQVNWAGKATGPFGEFGNLLVSPIGHSEKADKITIRVTPSIAEKTAKKLAELKGTGKIRTIEADFDEVVFNDGTSGPRTETWTNKDGQEVSQVAMYYRLASTPTWATEERVGEGNIDD
jgi:hypothetical protein